MYTAPVPPCTHSLSASHPTLIDISICAWFSVSKMREMRECECESVGPSTSTSMRVSACRTQVRGDMTMRGARCISSSVRQLPGDEEPRVCHQSYPFHSMRI
jgi:hypothetical protein